MPTVSEVLSFESKTWVEDLSANEILIKVIKSPEIEEASHANLENFWYPTLPSENSQYIGDVLAVGTTGYACPL